MKRLKKHGVNEDRDKDSSIMTSRFKAKHYIECPFCSGVLEPKIGKMKIPECHDNFKYILIILLTLFALEWFGVIDIPYIDLPDFTGSRQDMIYKTEEVLDQSD
jgi:hypothetical protein